MERVATDRQKWLAKIALMVTCFFWASSFVVIRKAVEYYTPEDLAFFRYFVASIVIMALYFLRTRHNTVRLNDIPKIVLLGVVGIAVYNITLNLGEVQVTAATASFIIGQAPVVTCLLAFVFLKEKITPIKLLGLAISFSGVAIIALHNVTALHIGLSTVYIAISTFCGSLFWVMQKPLLKRIDPFQLTAWAIWGATLAMIFWAPSTIKQFHYVPWNITGWVIFIGVFPAAIAYALWSYGVAQLSVNESISYMYTIPFIVLIMGWVFLHNWPDTITLSGGLIALSGVFIVNLKKKR